MPYFSMSRLANSLELSMAVAAFVWPNTARPAARKASVKPAASAASGPTTVRSTAFSSAKFFKPSTSVSFKATLNAFRPIPALPGAQ